jgi:nitrile hydratase
MMPTAAGARAALPGTDGNGRQEDGVDGIHDLGGMHGFSKVERDDHEGRFAADWEAAVVAIMRGGRRAGLFNIDEFRHGIERMPPDRYLTLTYFERWLDGITRVLVEKGVVDPTALAARVGFFTDQRDAPATAALERPLPPPRPRAGERWPPTREETAPPGFVAGDRVVTRVIHPRGHTRLPRYARGKRGVVHRYHGVHVFPDTHAHGQGEAPQPLYSVRFEASELWADAAEPRAPVYIDLWESYLEPGG